MKLLIVTNHTTHSSYDSIYSIATALLKNSDSNVQIYVACTSISQDHFAGESTKVHCAEVNDRFNFDTRKEFFTRSNMSLFEIADFQIIFFRIDRVKNNPTAIFDYFNFVKKNALDARYVNSPEGLFATRSKKFLENFRDCCPEFEIVNSYDEVMRFAQDKPIVLKPLWGYGGAGIIRMMSDEDIDVDGQNIKGTEAIEYLKSQPLSFYPIMAMKYLKNVTMGDKRVVVAAGQCLGAVLRMPKSGSWVATLAQGATAISSEPDEDEMTIIAKIDPILAEAGISLYGIDTLVDNEGKRVLSEINTANVGGFVQIQNTSGRPVLDELATALLERLADG